MKTEDEPDTWRLVDSWWPEYVESHSALTNDDTARVLEGGRLAEQWPTLDAWWDTYTETGHSTVVDIAAVLDQVTEHWRTSDGPFDTDPLDADVTTAGPMRGPLRPHREEDWSQWLAQLLRSSAKFVGELFGEEVGQVPEAVRREDQLPNPGGKTRFADVVVCHDNRGFSVEVKLGDEAYGKTIETAALIETEYDDKDWTHVLLLPASKTSQLKRVFGSSVTSDDEGRLRIESGETNPIEVLHWRDVTTALRSLLRRGAVVDEHWAANAFLFCASVEQQILGFKPRPVIERLADPDDVVETMQPIMFEDLLNQQLTYLRERTDL